MKAPSPNIMNKARPQRAGALQLRRNPEDLSLENLLEQSVVSDRQPAHHYGERLPGEAQGV